MMERRFAPPWSVEETSACLTSRHDADAAPLFDLDQSVSTVRLRANCHAKLLGDDAVPENDVNGLAKLGEDILTFDVSDDALERAAAVADGKAVTVGYCTHWYTCSWPM
jgi:hypothetical protein